MSTLKIHTLETAPEASKALLKESVKTFGILPNLHAVLAESPNLLQAYKMLHDLFQNSSFDNYELTVVWQTINVEHECHYCIPAHTGIAHMMKVDPAITDALRNKETLPNAKLQALHKATLCIVRNRGNISKSEIQDFFAAGYLEQQLLEIILGVSQKVISNYTNNIANTPVDEPFQKFAWSRETIA